MATYSADEINNYIADVEDAMGMPPGLLLGIAMTESSYNPSTGYFRNVRNSVGATGLMQLRPVALADIKRAYRIDIDPYDALDSIFGAAALFALNYRYITYYLKNVDVTWDALIVAYNGGWSAGKYYLLNGVAPTKEGQNYIARVTDVMDWYA